MKCLCGHDKRRHPDGPCNVVVQVGPYVGDFRDCVCEAFAQWLPAIKAACNCPMKTRPDPGGHRVYCKARLLEIRADLCGYCGLPPEGHPNVVCPGPPEAEQLPPPPACTSRGCSGVCAGALAGVWCVVCGARAYA